jgi:ribosomal protein S12 methylthiotransferase accessory factor
VAPELFALFSDRQLAQPGFPFRRFTTETVTTWVAGEELPGGTPAWLPAELVFLGPAGLPDQRPVGHATSSGLACGSEASTTVVRGLCELLERDAFMIVWSNRLSLPLLEPPHDSALEAPFGATGLAYAAVDLSVFHQLPIALAVVRAPEGCPGAVGVGAAAAATPERARWKALAEAFATRAAGATLAVLAGGAPVERIAGFDDHIRYYADGANAAATFFLDASCERMRSSGCRASRGRRPRRRSGRSAGGSMLRAPRRTRSTSPRPTSLRSV